MTRKKFCLHALAAVLCSAGFLPCAAAQTTGPKGGTLLLIRHAEKPDDGDGLTPDGEARAQAYIKYFGSFQFHAEPVKIDEIYASHDSKHSRRPRLTTEPLAKALGLPLNTTYKDKDYAELVTALQARPAGKNILICWHHGVMPELLRALGADPATVLPGGRWPENQYDWLIVLRYDQDGHLKEAQRVEEGLTSTRPQ